MNNTSHIMEISCVTSHVFSNCGGIRLSDDSYGDCSSVVGRQLRGCSSVVGRQLRGCSSVILKSSFPLSVNF